MLYLDVKYLKQVAYRLDRFKIKKDNGNTFLANCRCPICGDSETSQKKARGYFYNTANSLMFKCHNCNASMGFSKWLKDFDFNAHSQYLLEVFKNKKETYEVLTELKTKAYRPSILEGTKSVLDLPDDHPVLNYLIERKLPKDRWNLLYYAPKFFKWTKQHVDKFKDVDDSRDHPRLIIPWFDVNGECFAYQARSFGDEQPKYFSITVDKKPARFYGLERLNRDEKIYVLEGPLDSLFLPNAIAVGSSSLHTFADPGLDITYVLDNENRNREILKEYQKIIKMNVHIFIPTDTYTYKDVNEAVQNGFFDIKQFIDDNTYSGLKAQVRFNEWRKIEYENV